MASHRTRLKKGNAWQWSVWLDMWPEQLLLGIVAGQWNQWANGPWLMDQMPCLSKANQTSQQEFKVMYQNAKCFSLKDRHICQVDEKWLASLEVMCHRGGGHRQMSAVSLRDGRPKHKLLGSEPQGQSSLTGNSWLASNLQMKKTWIHGAISGGLLNKETFYWRLLWKES